MNHIDAPSMRPPLKYLTISFNHPQILKGGAQYVAKDLHDAACSDPEVATVFLAGIDGTAFPEYTKVGASITSLPDGIDEFVLSGARFDDFYHVIYDPRRMKALKHFLLTVRPDVIHVHHSIWVGLEVLQLAKSLLKNVKIVYTLHEYIPICYSRGQLFRYSDRSVCTNTAPDQCVKCFPELSAERFFLRRRMFKKAFDLVDAFVAPSKYLRKRFVDWGIAEEKIVVIANGHHVSRPEEWTPKRSKDVNVFGFFGQYIDAKGIDVLLEAAVQVAEETPVEIRIFGGNKQYASAEYVEKIDAILADAPENLKAIEVGAYSRDNVFDLMCSVDWVVVPSVWPETFALVVSEAWDAKRPVIASKVGGLADRIVPGKNGLLFAPGSTNELAAVMTECAGNEELWSEMADKMSDEISVETAWEKHKALFDELLSEPELVAEG